MKGEKKINEAFPEITTLQGAPSSAATKEAILRDLLGVEAKRWIDEIQTARAALTKTHDRLLKAERDAFDAQQLVAQMRDVVNYAQQEVEEMRAMRRPSITERILRRFGL